MKKHLGIAFLAGMAGFNMAFAEEDADVQEGIRVMPALLSVKNPDSGKGNEKSGATPGVEYDYSHTFGAAEGVSPDGIYTSLSGEGRFAFDRKKNVGNIIDFSVNTGYRHRWLALVDPNGKAMTSGHGYLTGTLKASFQANQSLSDKQTLVGIETRAFYAPTSTPEFAANLWPAFILGYDRVKPTGEDARASVDPSLSAFNRLHGRASSSLQLGKFARSREIKLEFKIDHWQDVGPSPAMRAAGLDRQTYRAVCLREASSGKNEGWSITYASGKVPTDQVNAKVWKIGYTFSGKFM